MTSFRFPASALAALWSASPPAFSQQRLEALDSAQVSMVWSGHPVDFALIEKNDTLYAGYYAADPDRQLTIARRLPSGAWSRTGLNTAVGWDSHNYVTLLLDWQNRLHVSGNMHGVPLIYYRAGAPGDIASLARVPSMVGSQEGAVTYPVFFRGPAGEFLFMYRDGGSGNGNTIVNTWNPARLSWSRLLATPLFDGEGARNAYFGGPSAGPVMGPGDGFYHLFWFWRSTSDAATTHRVSYVRSRNLTQWQTGSGTDVALPLRFSTPGVIADPVPERAGLINRGQIGFDGQGRPILSYHKHDTSPQGYTQLYNARLENGAWKVYRTTDWTYRWNFGGSGSLVIEIEFGPVTLNADGTLTQWYKHSRHGRGVLVLNPATLHADQVRPDAYWPARLEPARRSGMEVHWLQARSSADPALVYALRWETLPANQDRPRTSVPAPTSLMWYHLRDPNMTPTVTLPGPSRPEPRVRGLRASDLLGRRAKPSTLCHACGLKKGGG